MAWVCCKYEWLLQGKTVARSENRRTRPKWLEDAGPCQRNVGIQWGWSRALDRIKWSCPEGSQGQIQRNSVIKKNTFLSIRILGCVFMYNYRKYCSRLVSSLWRWFYVLNNLLCVKLSLQWWDSSVRIVTRRSTVRPRILASIPSWSKRLLPTSRGSKRILGGNHFLIP